MSSRTGIQEGEISCQMGLYFCTVFSVTCGVCLGGILSPILFTLYLDELIDSIRNSGSDCFVNNTFVECVMYTDDFRRLYER